MASQAKRLGIIEMRKNSFIARTWEVTVTLQRTISMPVEDGEDKKALTAWLKTDIGLKHALNLVVSNARVGDWSANADLFIDEVELKEEEVTATDFNPNL